MKRIRLGVLLICLLIICSACSGSARLRQVDTQTYTNAAGYHMQLPADWQLVEEEAEASVFLSADSGVCLTVFNELGGEAYYGLDEITTMLLEQLPAQASGWQGGRVITENEAGRRQVFTGVDDAGNDVYLDITVLQPHPGIRYYLLFASGSAVYNTQNTLFGDIVSSFTLDEDVTYLYALMEERRGEDLDAEEE